MRRFIKIEEDYFEAHFQDEKIFYENGSIASRITPSEYYILKTKISLFDIESANLILLHFNNKKINSLDIYNIDDKNQLNSIFRLYGVFVIGVTYNTETDVFKSDIEICADYSECTNDVNNFSDIIKHIRNKRIEQLGIL